MKLKTVGCWTESGLLAFRGAGHPHETADTEVLDFAWENEWLLVSHDVNTLKGEAEQRIANGDSVHGVFFTAQSQPTRTVAESVVLIWEVSVFDEWRDRIVYLPL
ncbi:MAG: hypothetical protein QF473_25500 [Planctomycetota bacterium]|nr:hypothetical protein [Planctomycetota bacterium]